MTAVIPTWQALTALDLSHNSISEIDDSVVCPPWPDQTLGLGV